ncbi:MAG: D-alanyl-D-alanine carboxypeptidase, partial [Clostridia bacterium]|nr:D-alanyl-D-alanine carboxypeptidase [Clostridia bacterium]
TKLMTLLMMFEELEGGGMTVDDSVTISKEAAAQKGSQALLDAGAVYSLGTLLKCTIVASANDAACALAEQLSGTEASFVERMNARAQELGMTATHYVNCTGLPQTGQQTTARDIATLSCELSKYPKYHEYASIWMDTLKHPSGRTTDLTNTNRLVRFYKGCDGFKTGSTDEAKYCLSATAEKDGMRLIAVVLGAPASQKRFDDARTMLDYGFSSYRRLPVLRTGDLLGKQVAVKRGASDQVEAAVGSGISMLLRLGQEKQLSLEVELPEEVSAPIEKGQTLGTIRVMLGGQVVAKIPAVAASEVRMPSLLEGFYRLMENWR